MLRDCSPPALLGVVNHLFSKKWGKYIWEGADLLPLIKNEFVFEAEEYLNWRLERLGAWDMFS